jgi:hypothetical protein
MAIDTRPLEIRHIFIARDPRLAYGAGLTDCEIVGIGGGCGNECPVLWVGHCEDQDEMNPDGSIMRRLAWQASRQ